MACWTPAKHWFRPFSAQFIFYRSKEEKHKTIKQNTHIHLPSHWFRCLCDRKMARKQKCVYTWHTHILWNWFCFDKTIELNKKIYDCNKFFLSTGRCQWNGAYNVFCCRTKCIISNCVYLTRMIQFNNCSRIICWICFVWLDSSELQKNSLVSNEFSGNDANLIYHSLAQIKLVRFRHCCYNNYCLYLFMCTQF